MTALNVPFREKDEAKALGARWNPMQKIWYVPEGLELVNFNRWLADSAPSESAQTTVLLSTTEDMSQAAQQGIQLSTYLQRLSAAVRDIYPKNEWVRAEISEWREHRGAVYLSLVEHDTAGQAVAKINARIWPPYPTKMQEKFKQITGSPLEPGIKVLLSVRAEFHIQYGVSVMVEDVDPTYTLGDMAAKLAGIRQTLTAEKIIDHNKQLLVPQEFVSVAVVAPRQAAGLGDFRREADLLQRFGLCEFHYYFATFQGQTASVSVSEAFEQAVAAHETKHFDALVIIRGGGAVTDLAWLNELVLARLVCRSPVAVITGIGHERDSTILDEVACLRLDTPSKVISYIFTRIKQNAQQAQNDFNTIIKMSQRWQYQYQQETQRWYGMIESLAQQHCQYTAQQIRHTTNTIEVQALHITETTATQVKSRFEGVVQQARFVHKHTQTLLNGLMREVLGQGPHQVLQRGFVIVRTDKGEVVSDKQRALTQAQLTLEFRDGVLKILNTELTQPGDKLDEQ